MDLRELIRSRRTVHNFSHEKVDDRMVEQALALSLWAPNHKLTFPWVYIWLGPETRERLGALNEEMKGSGTPKGKAARENVTAPSHLISLGLRRSPDKPRRQHEDYATLACSVQIASLWLWRHGICTKWSTGDWSLCERAYEIIGVNPEEVQLEGCLMIGRERNMPEAPERPALERFLRRTE